MLEVYKLVALLVFGVGRVQHPILNVCTVFSKSIQEITVWSVWFFCVHGCVLEG